MDFEEFVSERTKPLLQLAYVLTRDRQRAEDLTQTALLTVYQKWRLVSRARSPEAYARRILVNSHLDWHRRRSSTERPMSDTAEDRAQLTNIAESVVQRLQLAEALRSLPPRARAILVLRYYEDLSDEEIAEHLSIGVSSVRSTASRALAKLREHVVNTWIEET